MRIAAFSINPLFPNKINGGSPKHLQNVMVHLGELGHQVTILCTRHPDNPQPFQWHPNVTVRPVLPFKQPFPEPYAVPAYRIADMIHEVGHLLEQADRFYMHDGELLFPPIYQHIPTTISLRDNVYPETILGSFLFQGDALIAIADYSAELYQHTAGRYLNGLDERMITINNGIDFSRFSPTGTTENIRKIIDVDSELANNHIILHPHRPEPSKGLQQTIETVDYLVHEHAITNIRVLVPRWFDADISAEVRAYYDSMNAQIAQRGLEGKFIFHGWIPQELMPEYYRLGNLTLVLGSFVEAFGNVAYESLACGTPAIVAKVATHRSLMPDHLIEKVHFGDSRASAAAAAKILNTGSGTTPQTMSFLKQKFGIEQQLNDYANTILNATKLPPIQHRFESITPETQFVLAPWCYTWSNQIYHDFDAQHTKLPNLVDLIQQNADGISAAGQNLDFDQIYSWYKAGFITPKPALQTS